MGTLSVLILVLFVIAFQTISFIFALRAIYMASNGVDPVNSIIPPKKIKLTDEENILKSARGKAILDNFLSQS